MVSSSPARRRTALVGNHTPPPPEYALEPPKYSDASTSVTASPSRAAVYAPQQPPAPDPTTSTSVSSAQSTMLDAFPLVRCGTRHSKLAKAQIRSQVSGDRETDMPNQRSRWLRGF